MLIKFFLKQECPNCSHAKNIIERLVRDNNQYVQKFDIETSGGLAEAAFYGVMSVPSLLFFDNNEILKFGYYSLIPTYDDVIQKIKIIDEIN